MGYSPSLYIHIPFCVAKCGYCDFFSRPCSSVGDSYVDALLNQCSFLRTSLEVESWNSVYIGGGTPSLLSEKQLEKLLCGVISGGESNMFGSSVARGAEVTVEVNPETLTEGKLLLMEQIGVTRISMGIQSMNQHALDAVGRHCNRDKVIEALELLKSKWHGRLNLDAIAGLPLQNQDQFMQSLGEIVSYEPNHVSLYSLMVEDGTPLEEKIRNGLPWDADEADRQWLLGRDFLQEKGYRQYEVSNFAREGQESRHNLAYWRQMDYLACGAGGCGTAYDFASGKAYRYTNSCNVDEYQKYWNGKAFEGIHSMYRLEKVQEKSTIERLIEEWPCEKEVLDLETVEYEFLMMGLRTLEGVNSMEYGRRFSLLEPWKGDLHARLGKEGRLWGRLMDEGKAVCRVNGDGSTNFALNEEGILFLNSILVDL